MAGPTPRSTNPVKSWRPRALEILRGLGFEGLVFVPEDEDGEFSGTYIDQVGWEQDALHRATIIVFWVPRDLKTLPGFTTNVEFGFWLGNDPGKVVLGHPEGAPKTKYLDWMLRSQLEPDEDIIHNTLDETLQYAMDRVEILQIVGTRT